MNLIAPAAPRPARPAGTAFGCPRDFGGRRFVYTVVSARAGGLSVGVDMNPDRHCNFDCVYCEVDRSLPVRDATLDVAIMSVELEDTLRRIQAGDRLLTSESLWPSAEWSHLKQVALSGDGEPTLCPNFLEAVETVVLLRASRRVPFFKLALITNATGLDRPEVQAGLKLFTPRDEIWAKLEAGTEAYFQRVNRPDCPLEKILANILLVARQRPVIIQSLFPLLDSVLPPAAEIQAFAGRLADLVAAGARISLVQIYSASLPPANRLCGHLALRQLSEIARQVRQVTGLEVEVF
jgi:wyosine [tRNA(Phe)-imidazoG37] synthetase (radical SAM superfamily)